MDETFVFEGQEVRKTGRIAIKKVQLKEIVLVEIVPVNEFLTDQKKWVREIDLYRVQKCQ